ncbi:MAG: hypothetical protein M1820_001006 [Bogoriella megaspora]|nr:MAG: hypothetical protein M1820_001006 [Bogoriella megaspora]
MVRDLTRLDPSRLTPYENVASGHDGVLTDESGDIVIKPCTTAEIDFYQHSLNEHPEFAEYMPTFMGTLKLGAPQQHIKTSPAIARSPMLSRAPTLPVHPPAAAQESDQLLLKQPIGNSSSQGSSQSSNVSGSSDASAKKSASAANVCGTRLETDEAIVLENIAAGFKRPNILDIKLGARLWADDAPPEKRARLDKVATDTTSGSLGFRIAGMRVWRGKPSGSIMPSEQPRPGDTVSGIDGIGDSDATLGSTSGVVHPANVDMSGSPTTLQVETEGITDPGAGYQVYDKFYGRNFNETTVRNAFDEFFLPADYVSDITARRHVIAKCLEQLAGMQYHLEKADLRMYSASILCVYEGANTALDEAIDASKQQAPPAAPFKLENASLNLRSNLDEKKSPIQGGASVGAEEDDGEDEDEEEELPKVCALKLIDFAHAQWTPGQGPDENILQGVRNVRKFLEELLASTNTHGTTTDL